MGQNSLFESLRPNPQASPSYAAGGSATNIRGGIGASQRDSQTDTRYCIPRTSKLISGHRAYLDCVGLSTFEVLLHLLVAAYARSVPDIAWGKASTKAHGTL
eukprot:199630-Rhodomonas_salina.1